MIWRATIFVAIAAMWALRHRWRDLLANYAVLAYCTLLHAATHAEARLSEPLFPLLIVLLAGACITMLRASSAERRPRVIGRRAAGAARNRS